jgi:hypothetical protein
MGDQEQANSAAEPGSDECTEPEKKLHFVTPFIEKKGVSKRNSPITF